MKYYDESTGTYKELILNPASHTHSVEDIIGLNIINETQNGGYFKDNKSGLIIQWGFRGGSGRVTFPTPFPNKCINVFCQGEIKATTSPTYMVFCGAKVNSQGQWDLDGFDYASMGYYSVGAQGAEITTLTTNGAITASPNFSGTGNWMAIGF